MTSREIFETSVYLLATINPASKIFLLSSMDPPYGKRELFRIAAKSSLVAFIMMAFLGIVGDTALVQFFRIDLYSLKVAGGMVLLFVGMHAVSKGRFYETEDFDKISDVSIVPLAAPFIAGPGSITVSITIATQQGYLAMILSVALAVVANMLFMLCSPVLGKTLEKVHAIGPAVRITGLVVMAMAVQMILGGLSDWLRPVLR